MPTLKELRIRVKSLKNTQKITSAMKMVSAAKLRRAKDASLRSKPYIEKMDEILKRVQSSSNESVDPLMQERDINRVLYVIFSSDRGLCGGYNNSLFKFFSNYIKNQSIDFDVVVAGKKAYEFCKRKKMTTENYFSGVVSQPEYQKAQDISKYATESFLSKKHDKVILFYNQFVSTIAQKPARVSLLPFVHHKEKYDGEHQSGAFADYIFEPKKESILSKLLPRQVSLQIFQCLLDNSAGEHAARMTAMDSATNNAKELISNITVQMNRARQAAITKELIEVVSGAESLNN